MEIKVFTTNDKAFVKNICKEICDETYDCLTYTKAGYVLWDGNQRVGIINHCILWGNIPSLNLIYVDENFRGRGFASKALSLWEQLMKKSGYKMVLLSTRADETSQHLYRKLGYSDCGGIIFENTPFDQPAEIFFKKVL